MTKRNRKRYRRGPPKGQPITHEVLKQHGDVLARVLLLLKKKHPDLKSADFWKLLKKRWTTEELERALANFAEGRILKPFDRVLRSGGEKRRPYGFWKIWPNVERELRTWIGKHARFPSNHDLEKAGLSSLSAAISKYHHGMPAVRKRMGFGPSVQKPKGYWKDPANIKREIDEVVETLGQFPTIEDLVRLKKSSLSRAIYLYHGSIDTVRRSFEPDDPSRWRNLQLVQDKLLQIVAELGRVPALVDLKRLGLQPLYRATYNHHGGYPEVLKSLGLPRPQVLNNGALKARRPRGAWNFEQIVRVLSELVVELGRFPTREDLEVRGFSGLYNSIWKRHGGMKAIHAAMAKLGHGPITPALLTEHAEPLARALLKLRKERKLESAAFWKAIKSRWTAKNLRDAVESFKKAKSLDAFRKLLDQT